jgi:Undecaprenyl-phosphate glucose phosphotransferase
MSVMSRVIDTNHPQEADLPRFGAAAVQRSSPLNRILYKIVAQEFVAIFLAATCGIALYYWGALGFQVPAALWVPFATTIATLVVLFSLGFRHYPQIQTKRKRWYVTVGVGAVGAGFSVFLTLLFLLKISDEYSRGAFFFQLLAVGAVITAVRAITHDKLRASIARNEVEARRVILVGRESDCLHIANKITKSGLRIQKIIPFPAAVTTQGDETNPVVSCPKDSVFREIVQQCRPLCPDDILILANENDVANVERIARVLSVLPASLHMMPIGLENILATSKFSEIGLLPTIQLLQQPLTLFDRFIKRALDMIVAAIGLVLLCPLFLLVMTVIKLESRGPAVFRQSRHGFNNETIRVFKFRTMRTVEDGEHFTQAVKNDPRVTVFGAILRKTNIDELPQLVNVLLGEMSLVGPRPHPIALNLKYEDKLAPLFRRHNVKPGITGWAQVNGCRGETDTVEKMQQRLICDLYYIDHWSFLFDIQIIMMTLLSKKAYSNAY